MPPSRSDCSSRRQLRLIGQNQVQRLPVVVDAFHAIDQRPALDRDLAGIVLHLLVSQHPADGHGQI